ncbi:hypothetical protein CPK_ORF00340 [Chlamydia pneumoniae LPCoLN]|nr:hypothetical protein CPK_ORF00340 [Chlamydia pneumoniae LPCoLN]ETR79693.1 hypothetical protein X556_0973 [Chlamydia pneumoniae B21]
MDGNKEKSTNFCGQTLKPALDDSISATFYLNLPPSIRTNQKPSSSVKRT